MSEPLTDEELGELRRLAETIPSQVAINVGRLLDEHARRLELLRRAYEYDGHMPDEEIEKELECSTT